VTIRHGLSALTLVATTAILAGQPAAKVQFVEVEPDVRLEVVDIGEVTVARSFC
jgi:hypothetical protein